MRKHKYAYQPEGVLVTVATKTNIDLMGIRNAKIAVRVVIDREHIFRLSPMPEASALQSTQSKMMDNVGVTLFELVYLESIDEVPDTKSGRRASEVIANHVPASSHTLVPRNIVEGQAVTLVRGVGRAGLGRLLSGTITEVTLVPED